MKYRGKTVEVIGVREVFGRKIAWIRYVSDGGVTDVSFDQLEATEQKTSVSGIRFAAIAARIRNEIATKRLLAPYESSLLPLPHQVLVLEKVIQSNHNRFLLADEVGMGKTIEAGLVLKELKLRGECRRILAIVPKSSMMQWQAELREHFNEIFHIYDSEIITALTRTFSTISADQEFNFWEQHNQIIVSTDALKPVEQRQGWSRERVELHNKYRMEAVLNADFDMVIIDEAHKMGGATQMVSRYQLAQALCNVVPNVLLLTATPHRGKSDHFRRILQLLDPDAFTGEGFPTIKQLEPYVIRTEKRKAVDYDGERLFNERETRRLDVMLHPVYHKKQRELYKAITTYVKAVFTYANDRVATGAGLMMVLFQKLASSSTAAILQAMQRRMYRLEHGEEQGVNEFGMDADSGDPVQNQVEDFDFSQRYHPDVEPVGDERAMLSELIRMAEDVLRSEQDAKTSVLIEKYEELKRVSGDPDLKIIVFTEFRTTQRMIKEVLTKKGFRCATINGGQSIEVRRSELVKFREEVQVLIATDAAGESLNMQFCHVVINYDLPWNPMMLEQRIGRVDRIGQKHKVAAFNMVTDNSIDARVYEVIQEKLDAILSQLGIDKTADVLDSTIDMRELNKLYLQSLLDPARFEAASEQWLYEIRQKLKNYQSTEGVLPEVDEKEIDPERAAEIKYSYLPVWLMELTKEYVRTKGGHAEFRSEGVLYVDTKEKKGEVTFDSEVAIQHPGIEHITLQHEWVKQMLDHMEETQFADGIPVVIPGNGDETSGIWSLWKVSGKNNLEQKAEYHAFFKSDEGKQYSAYALDIWTRLISGDLKLTLDYKNVGMLTVDQLADLFGTSLENIFQKIEVDLQQLTNRKYENRIRAYGFRKDRINRIGIENIRKGRLAKLEKEHQAWLKDFGSSTAVIPGLKHILSFKLNV